MDLHLQAVVVAAYCVLAGCSAARREPWPTLDDAQAFEQIAMSTARSAGRIVAFEGVTRQVLHDRGHPVLRVELKAQTSRAPGSDWVAFVEIGPPPANLGDSVKVLGYFVPLEQLRLEDLVAVSGWRIDFAANTGYPPKSQLRESNPHNGL